MICMGSDYCRSSCWSRVGGDSCRRGVGWSSVGSGIVSHFSRVGMGSSTEDIERLLGESVAGPGGVVVGGGRGEGVLPPVVRPVVRVRLPGPRVAHQDRQEHL